MSIELPVIVLAGGLVYFGFRLHRPPAWLVVVTVLFGLLLAYTAAGPAIHDGVQSGVDDVNK